MLHSRFVEGNISHGVTGANEYFKLILEKRVCQWSKLEDIVMPFPYAQTTFVNAALFHV